MDNAYSFLKFYYCLLLSDFFSVHDLITNVLLAENISRNHLKHSNKTTIQPSDPPNAPKKCTAKMQRHFLRQLWGRKKKNIDTSVTGTLKLIGVNYGMSASF